jgi:hypothetical protein
MEMMFCLVYVSGTPHSLSLIMSIHHSRLHTPFPFQWRTVICVSFCVDQGLSFQYTLSSSQIWTVFVYGGFAAGDIHVYRSGVMQ